MDNLIRDLNDEASKNIKTIKRISEEFSKVIVGQEKLLKGMISALLSGGHLLVEGVPGLAKTLAIRTLAGILDLDYKRVQFTPDMLPADIRGTMIYNQNNGSFEVRKGPVFTNFLLADEINRAPSKVQSALLESMQESSVTIGDTTYPIEAPFFVMATQNPIEQEGTYPLPEAQTDRFYMKLLVGYPTIEEEKIIMNRMSGMTIPAAVKAANKEDILSLQNFTEKIYTDPKIFDYVALITDATRKFNKNHVLYGASPRASICFIRASKANAFLEGRGYVIPEDVKAVAYDILRHRIIVTFEAEAEGITSDHIIEQILNTVEIP